MTKRQQWIIIVVLLIGAPIAACALSFRQFTLQRMPNDLEVYGIDYRLEESLSLIHI